MKKVCSIDTETISLEDRTLVGFSCADNSHAEYYPIAHNKFPNSDKMKCKKMLQEIVDTCTIVFHNSSFDVPVLTNWGIDFSKVDIHDTLIIANLLDENVRHGLKVLSKRYLGYTMIELKEIVGTGKNRISVADADKRILKYAADDAMQTLKLYEYLYPRLLQDKKLFKLYNEIEKPLLSIVADMHLNGVMIDAQKVKNIKNLCAQKVKIALEKLEFVMPDVNYNSTKQLREFFIRKENMFVLKETKKGAPAMDKEVLMVYAETNVAAKLLLEYRKYAKILSTFIPAMTPKIIDIETGKGKIYPSFNQSGTTSGRFSSSRPNFQNIPKDKDLDFRACIVAEEGHVLIGYDYSQIELRILAHVSQDFNLMKAYRENLDIHQLTADACGISRDKAKTVNFGIVYGMHNKTLGKRIKVSPDDAQRHIDTYMQTYSAIKPFWEHAEEQVRLNGYVETIFGRKRHRTREFGAKDRFDQSREIGSMTNSIIQGSGADILKTAMVSMYPLLTPLGARIVACVHDEILVSCPKEKQQQGNKIVRECMLKAASILSVPMQISGNIGGSWRDVHE